ncbi:predicted protein [Nematostella vectensis]|uniref:Mon2/Sec7/BIG1-like HUS domain-containing protein n=1 Tax=Nematostella vectensis TaxID=45351 RepID=A7T1W4_NEMVE|nr:predicted protein [Nematostella vectensis]|eukprot:XP_001622148.1 hypothetical protein NEMVEDRAFT_v1g221089 [Nematostella vectensis]
MKQSFFIRLMSDVASCNTENLLIQCDFLGLFAMALRVCFLLFEALRVHLKLQFEMFFKKLMEILTMDMQGVHYEKRELVLDAINQYFGEPFRSINGYKRRPRR